MYGKINSIITVEAASSLLFFEKNNLTQKLIHFLKYKNYPELGSWLAELWYLENKDKISLKNIQSVIPVLVNPKRLKKRNYNQVEQCAKRLASLLGCDYDESTLTRIKHKES